ncbi:MAG TPA: maleylpyruvate isomerase family mycothiol-dependent enzyme [Nocardioides sp.]|nr:maleylpyruvate isomerase family mycothiol-dependent enzyme [Nocardioides sp.]
MVDRTHLEELTAATRRLVRTVDGMAEHAYAEPSLLPDWTRGHVVAHLALNAEGMAGALRGLTEGSSVPMYASPEARDSDIAALGTASPEAIRSRLLGGATDFVSAVTSVPPEAWSVEVERTPGGRTFKAGAIPDMRHREVEIHHADLGLGYTHADWPREFAVRLIEAMARRERPTPFSVRALDLGRTWQLGDGGPTVSGPAAELGWWLTGRGDGAALSSDDGALPRIEAW